MFVRLRLSFNAVNRYLCEKFVYNISMSVEQCALMHMLFGNDQGVCLLGHVRLLE